MHKFLTTMVFNKLENPASVWLSITTAIRMTIHANNWVIIGRKRSRSCIKVWGCIIQNFCIMLFWHAVFIHSFCQLLFYEVFDTTLPSFFTNFLSLLSFFKESESIHGMLLALAWSQCTWSPRTQTLIFGRGTFLSLNTNQEKHFINYHSLNNLY